MAASRGGFFIGLPEFYPSNERHVGISARSREIDSLISTSSGHQSNSVTFNASCVWGWQVEGVDVGNANTYAINWRVALQRNT